MYVGILTENIDGCYATEIKACFVGNTKAHVIAKMLRYEKYLIDGECKCEGRNINGDELRDLERMRKDLETRDSFDLYGYEEDDRLHCYSIMKETDV